LALIFFVQLEVFCAKTPWDEARMPEPLFLKRVLVIANSHFFRTLILREWKAFVNASIDTPSDEDEPVDTTGSTVRFDDDGNLTINFPSFITQRAVQEVLYYYTNKDTVRFDEKTPKSLVQEVKQVRNRKSAHYTYYLLRKLTCWPTIY